MVSLPNRFGHCATTKTRRIDMGLEETLFETKTLFFFFFYQGFLSWKLIIHRIGGEGRGDLFLFSSTTSTRSRTFRHLCAKFWT